MVQAQNATETLDKVGASPDTLQETAQEQTGVADSNKDRDDAERATVHKTQILESANTVFANDPDTEEFKKITDLPIYREGALKEALLDANKTELQNAVFLAVRVLDAAGDGADRNSDLRKVKEALAHRRAS